MVLNISCQKKLIMYTLQGTNISHLGKRKIIFKCDFWWDMLVPWRVAFFPWCWTQILSDKRRGEYHYPLEQTTLEVPGLKPPNLHCWSAQEPCWDDYEKVQPIPIPFATYQIRPVKKTVTKNSDSAIGIAKKRCGPNYKIENWHGCFWGQYTKQTHLMAIGRKIDAVKPHDCILVFDGRILHHKGKIIHVNWCRIFFH